MLDCQIYGLRPGGHHLTNLLLHTAAVIVLFLVLRQMTGALWRSAFVAAVFAIHPLRVESVAWVAERKDVLSGLFFMLTIGAYVRYARQPCSPTRYGLVALLFAMGLMCKPMLVTLPLVLLLLDYWPLNRLRAGSARGANLRLGGWQVPWRVILEKLPLIALSAAACMVTLLAQTEIIQPAALASVPLRIANALVACMVYLGQMVFPAGLAVLYPFPYNGLESWKAGLAGMLLAGLSALAFRQRRKRPWLLVGWVWYLVMLLPVVGLIQVGSQAHADRYTYLPQIGIYVAVTWLVAGWGAKWRIGRAVFGSLMTGVLAVLMVCAWKQTAYWQNSETLWTHALACTTRNDMAHNNLGSDLLQKARVDEAMTHFQKALEIQPDYAEAHMNLGLAFFQLGRREEAIAQLQKAVDLQPDDAQARYNLGLAFSQLGRMDEAISRFEKALAIQPDYAEAQMNLGNCYFHLGRMDEAISQYQKALEIKPNDADGQRNLGLALLRQGRMDEAITHFQEGLAIQPSNAKAHINLGLALLQKGSVGEAIAQFEKALQLEPSDAELQNNLAWLLATCPKASWRNGHEAVELAQQANALTGGENPLVLHTLAAAFAETGRFSEAAETAQRALHLAEAQSNTRLTGQLQLEIKLYQAGSPYRGEAGTDPKL
jgi:tetratricopeptide (TPR) repeat protein